jgi:hypothetical protein
MPNEIHSYSELQHQIREALRIQHPEWVEPNGDCPTSDSYEVAPGRITRSQSALKRGENGQILFSR